MNYIFFGYLIPLIASMALALPFRFSEKFITRLTTFSLLIPIISTIFLFNETVLSQLFPLEQKVARVLISGHEFPFIFWIDKSSFTLLALTHILSLLVTKFSHGYLHLERGYQRFFSTILFFNFGMELLSIAGNVDIFFAGWEIVGFSSFLLIAFYRSHIRSVSNAWRIYNIYRICDVGLLIGAVLGHVLWHEATRFSALSIISSESLSSINPFSINLLALSILLASLGKSAQFPFHNWPARAMEGPTPSSAIFYGALSIHAGVFLLIRTQPLWYHSTLAVLLIGTIGLLTLFFSSIQGRIQTNIKGQIAYSVTSQIGIMFIELSLGLVDLVLIHLFCHSLYRCFQMLVSPSIVASSTSLNNKVIFQRLKNRKNFLDKLPPRWRSAVYALGMNEFSMDVSWRGFGFLGWKKAIRYFHKFIGHHLTLLFTISLVALNFIAPYGLIKDGLSITTSLLALLFSCRSVFWHHYSFPAARELALSIVSCMLAVYYLDPAHFLPSIFAYIEPIALFLVAFLWICWKFRSFDLRNFHALGTKNSTYANIFMLSFMVLAGMPITTAFIGEDMLLENVLHHSFPLTLIITICLMNNGLLCAKIYSRLFMGRQSLSY